MRRILAILGLGLLIFLLRRLQGGRSRREIRRGPSPPEGAENLVRDRVCNTFIPARSAIALRRSGEVHYFCSARCRDRFLEGNA